MAKKIEGYLKMQVPAGGASPSPPIGPALGQRGLNIMEFCKAFNAKTQEMEANMPIPTIVTIYEDKSFDFIIKTPPASYYLKKAAKLPKGRFSAGSRGRRFGDDGAMPRNRRAENRRFEHGPIWTKRKK